MALGSGIRKKPIPDPGSRGQKGPGSRIRNTGCKNVHWILNSGLRNPKEIFTDPPICKLFVTNPVPGFSVSHFYMRRRPNVEGSVAGPGSGAFLTPGFRMVKKSGSGMNNPDHISKSLEIFFRVKLLKFFYADPGSAMEKIRIRDGKNSGPGLRSQIRNTDKGNTNKLCAVR